MAVGGTVGWRTKDVVKALYFEGLVQVLLLLITDTMHRSLDMQEQEAPVKEQLTKPNLI